MLSAHLIGIVLITSMLGSDPGPSGGPRFEECLRVVRSAPDSFLPYFCLGTPGVPEHEAETRAALLDVLRRKPREPHARIYLALMDTYAGKDPRRTEFTEPLATLEQRGPGVDVVLARLALVERVCFLDFEDCKDTKPLLESAERLAEALGEPSLLRLTRIARLKWSIVVVSRSEARRAEELLGPIPKNLPPWLALVEINSRATLATASGDDLRARDLYASLASASAPGTVTHIAAAARLGITMADLAWQGLASREDAERILRASLAEQGKQALGDYTRRYFGLGSTASTLALLLGRTEETTRLINDTERSPMTIEFLLQGTPEHRSRALSYAREITDGPGLRNTDDLIARAHAEFWAGSSSEGIRWGRRAIKALDLYRERESIEEIRMKGDWRTATPYQIVVSDLLDTRPWDPEHLKLAFEVSERLRARILLEKLLKRRGPLASAPSEPTLPQIQSALGGDEAIVSFLVSSPRPNLDFPYVRGHSWALVISKDRVSAVRIAQGEFLEPAVRAWARQVDARAPDLEPGSVSLYRQAIDPVLSALPSGVRSLILVPDGPLHRLPFDALSDGGGQPYLAERYQIAIVPSVAVWIELRRGPRSPPGLALAFANTPEGPATRVAEMRGEIEPGQLGVLEHAREEAMEAVNAFSTGSTLFAGADATTDRLTPATLRRASLVHFAAHGVLDPLHPDESFLLLAPGAAGSGVLKLADVPRFDWSGKTIVLSACQTSAGAFRIGEGVLSLARGFFAGGATAVIGTLSRVRDDEQYELVKRFYRELRTGASVADALTAAKRSLIAEGAPPAAWANVVLLGDGTIRPLGPLRVQTSSWRRPELAVALGVVVAALGLVALLIIGNIGAGSLTRLRLRGRSPRTPH
jgi:CHAT domain-containing protein